MLHRWPLHHAASVDDARRVRALIEAECDVNRRTDSGSTPLHHARSTEVVDALVAAGADVNAADNFGFTPLHNFAEFYRRQLVEAALDAGANVDIPNFTGHTARNELLKHHSAEEIETMLRRARESRSDRLARTIQNALGMGAASSRKQSSDPPPL